MLGFSDIPDEEKTDKNVPPTLVKRRFSGLTGEELSEMAELSHKSVYIIGIKYHSKEV